MEKNSASDEKKVINTKPIKNRFKKVGCFMGIFLAIFLLCAGSIGVFWAGGWMKDLTCDVVMEDSIVFEKAGCSPTEKETLESRVDENNVINIQLPDEVESTEELVTNVIEQVSPAVVTVAVNRLALNDELGVIDQNDGIGSGFVVDSEGLIITNKHVVSDTDAEYSIFLPGNDEPVAVTEIYRDNIDDIALLKVEKNDLQALKLGDSDELKRGNLVIAIGNPFGDLAGTSTVGYVSGLNREVVAGGGFGTRSRYEGVIQTDAAINPGNSGGPLINSRGEVVGVNFATTQGADNISFAIPINRVKSRMEVFEQEGRFPQPYIGVSYSQRTIILQQRVITGAIILSVEEDGPADEAGLRRGDIVIEANEQNLSEVGFMTVIQSKGVGETIALKVLREGKELNIDVVVGDKGGE